MKKHGSTLLRVYALVAIMGFWGVVIAAQLYSLHIVRSDDFRQMAESQQQRRDDILPQRGAIYDRNGKELAGSTRVDSVFARPNLIEDREGAARVLSGITGVAYETLLDRLNSGRTQVWIKRKVSAAEAAAIDAAGLTGIHFEKETARFYPKSEMAAHVLGFVNIDEEGMAGLEFRYNDVLRGEPGRVLMSQDSRGRSFDRVEQLPVPGANLHTTIDENIQYIVEEELRNSIQQTRAEGMSIIVMDPHSGAILGMANYPTFDPNAYARSGENAWKNRAIQDVYEPGSTFKIVTVGAALEERLTRPDELIDCLMGAIYIHGHRIRDHKPFGMLTVTEIMQYSSSVGTIRIGQRIGDELFADYIRRFGFGRASGIDLPGETAGLFRPASQWSKISIGALSMGQEIGATPLQVVSMVSSVANGGVLYRPYIVDRIEHPERGVIHAAEPQGQQVISALTARQLSEMLEVVVTDGTARTSRLEGYRGAGKTGTAQKIDETGRYSQTKYVASFAGYAPVSRPMVSIIVVIDEPKGAQYHGGQVAAPVFKKVAERVLQYRGVVPDLPEYAPSYAPMPVPPDVRPAENLQPGQFSDFQVVDASWNPLWADGGALGFAEITVPDFRGKSLRQVAEDSVRLELRLISQGSGQAVAQQPPAGTRVPAGAPVEVHFAVRP